MKILLITSNLNVVLVLQELLEDMKMNAYHVKQVEYTQTQINLQNVSNVLLMLFAHLELSLDSH